jgi:hypothetical protein
MAALPRKAIAGRQQGVHRDVDAADEDLATLAMRCTDNLSCRRRARPRRWAARTAWIWLALKISVMLTLMPA